MSKTIKRITDLIPDDRNANKGTPRGSGMLRDSLQRSGFGRPVLVDRNGKIIAGNKTIEEAVAAGFDAEEAILVRSDGKRPVIFMREDLDLDDDPDSMARYLATADNRVGQVSLDWNADEIAALLVEDPTIVQSMFNEDELDAILAGNAPEIEPADDPGAQVDRADELREQWGVERGQLWEIPSLSVPGKSHRLLCGDSTSAEDVGRLMQGERAQMVWTDPPYGVEYVGKTKNALTIQNDGAGGLAALLIDAFTTLPSVCIPSAPFYIAHPAGALCLVFGDAIRAVGWRLHQTLIWAKDSMVLGHSDYHFKHEPIYYGFLPGDGRPGRGNHEGSHWFGDHSQTSILEFDRPKRSEEHPTMKPPALVAYCIGNSSKPDGGVIDPFLGSGTTMVAAEQTGRVAYGLEIDPKYVAVALERMAGMGLEPLLVGQV